MYDIVIVGGGPAGLTAALYALRANKTVLVIDKSAFGGQMTLSPKIENYPGQESPSGIDLADRMTEQILTRGAEVELDEVTGIQVNPDGTKKVVAQYGEYDTKAVIIANGAKHRALGLEREVEFTGKGVYYCAVCDGGFFRNKEVALVGGKFRAAGSRVSFGYLFPGDRYSKSRLFNRGRTAYRQGECPAQRGNFVSNRSQAHRRRRSF